MKLLMEVSTLGRIVAFFLLLGFVAGMAVSCSGSNVPDHVAAASASSWWAVGPLPGIRLSHA